MSNVEKLLFAALDLTGKNYLRWVVDAEITLASKALSDTIKDGNTSTPLDKAKAVFILRHHLSEELKNDFFTVRDPLVLWTRLKERFDHQKAIVLPKARYDWMQLRFQDFKSVSDYNSALTHISSQLELCGEPLSENDMLEKTLSTFHASNMLLQQQYRERNFKKNSELITYLLVAETNNELLMKNHQSRPVGSTPFPEANTIAYNNGRRGRGRGRGRGGYRGRGRGRVQGHRNYGNHFVPYWKTDNAESSKRPQKKPQKGKNTICYKCGLNGHWSRTCRTNKHFVDLYQASIKGKEKVVETNMANIDLVPNNDPMENNNPMENINSGDAWDGTHLDISDFLEDI